MAEWTDEMIEELRRLHADGLTASEIAREMRISSRNAIIGKLHRLGLGRIAPRWPAKPRPARPAPRPPKAPPRAPEPEPRVLTGQCQWPIGDPRAPDFHFCLAPCDRYLTERPYCEEHRKLASRKGEAA